MINIQQGMSPQLYMSMHGLNNLINNNVQLERLDNINVQLERQRQQQQQPTTTTTLTTSTL